MADAYLCRLMCLQAAWVNDMRTRVMTDMQAARVNDMWTRVMTDMQAARVNDMWTRVMTDIQAARVNDMWTPVTTAIQATRVNDVRQAEDHMIDIGDVRRAMMASICQIHRVMLRMAGVNASRAERGTKR